MRPEPLSPIVEDEPPAASSTKPNGAALGASYSHNRRSSFGEQLVVDRIAGRPAPLQSPTLSTPGSNSTGTGTPKLKHSVSFGTIMKKNRSATTPSLAGLLPDAEEMKMQVRTNLIKKPYDVHDFYYDTGVVQKLARDHRFEQTTLFIIVVNALYMWIDTDYNHAETLTDAHLVFQVSENLFCLFFSTELLVRFLAFRRKCNCVRDAWFCFDSVLVTTMVLETWIMTYVLAWFGISISGGGLGNSGILRLLRLLRLSRMSRMARLLRSVPELMILLKGMAAASSSCCFTALLLVIAMYIWALALKQLSSGTDFAATYFPDIPNAMYNLLVTGCFMKDFALVMNDLKKESMLCTVIYFVFVLFSGVASMKMLTGMLCKVVNAIAATETEKMSLGYVKDELIAVLGAMGVCTEPGAVAGDSKSLEDVTISTSTFADMMHEGRALEAFRNIGVDVVGLITSADFIFPESEEFEDDDHFEHKHREVGFGDFLDAILQLRGSNSATVKDMVEIRKFVRREFCDMEFRLVHKLAANHLASPVSAAAMRASHITDTPADHSKAQADAAREDSPKPHCGAGGFSVAAFEANMAKSQSEHPTADKVFKQFHSLNEAQRGEFFALMAGGADCPSEKADSKMSRADSKVSSPSEKGEPDRPDSPSDSTVGI